MPSFDYINSPEFRDSLTSDYAEMRRCANSESWKSAQVLSGSIVECLLIDYLVSTANPARSTKDPLKMDMAEAILICKAEGALSERTSDLCSVVRSYRNLIHPGRMVRLNEPPPNKTTCDIATALIDLIVTDIAKTRRATVGLTAEQIISKVLRDSSAITILSHLLLEVSDQQRERLLLELLPQSYFGYAPEEDHFDDTHGRLASAFRLVLDSSSQDLKQKVAQNFVRILKEDDGDYIARYRAAFFRAPDLEVIAQPMNAMVKEHLLGSVTGLHTIESLKSVEGIGPYLETGDCIKWFDPFMRTLASSSAKEFLKAKCREVLIDTSWFTSKDFDKTLAGRLNDWLKHYEKLASEVNVKLVNGLQEEIVALASP